MIVKNEAARIERCLASVAPYISNYAILDTGSTDETIEVIKQFFKDRLIPGVIGKGAFRDFSQARNDALALGRAQQRRHPADFFLLCDADMEMRVDPTIPAPFSNLRKDAPAYTVLQCAGGVSYANTRLLNTKATALYRGATHEYLDIAVAGQLTGVDFLDHADGANRTNKAERDIVLLTAELECDPENPRTWFYLGNSYMDIGKWASAEFAYRKRIAIGGWDEEVHNAQVKLAHCMNNQGVESQFVTDMLTAYSMRPQRAEVLHDLTKHYRLKPGQQATALMFLRAGYGAKRPDDLLFVPDWVYNWGFKEEYTILGFYGTDEDKKRGAACANSLALDPSVPPHVRWGARQNLRWYVKPLSAHCPSFSSKLIEVRPPAGYTAMNPSVANDPDTGGLCAIVRTVNYTIDGDGRYLIKKDGSEANGTNPINTINLFVRLDNDLVNRAGQMEIMWERPAPAFDLVTGLEDMRLFHHGGFWMATACIREQLASGMPQQILCQLDDGWEITEWKALSNGSTCEKNWMPIPDDHLFYIDRLDTIRASDGISVKVGLPAVDNISGGSPLIKFKNGWLGIVHEAIDPGDYRRVYIHRWVWLSEDHTLRRLSVPFCFHDRQIEFAAGLAAHPNGVDLVVSYGVRDCEARIARVAATEVSAMLSDFYEG